ncbi:MAG: sigma-70 family RNA polymerase sigma factor [Ruminococcaceae bacterium]|nr:sigma-70 family RNA polymerase sigma factor [Oscillospiraceae bacterium]
MNEKFKDRGVLDLIAMVRDGNDGAFEELLQRYTPLIEASVARVLGEEQYSLYRDDFKQEATLVFYNAILSYNMEQHEVEFGLFAKICISNALISQLRVLKKRQYERLSGTSDEELFVHDSTDPSLKVLEQENLKALYSKIKSVLSDYEYRIWQLYMSGKTAKDIGNIVGRDERSVNNAIYRIRKKLREELQ